MKKTLYLVLAIIGLIVPYSFLIDYLRVNGFESSILFGDLFNTSISTFFVVNVLIAMLVVITFIVLDSKSTRVKFITVPVIATLIAGPSCGLPLYLYLREIESASWVETLDEK